MADISAVSEQEQGFIHFDALWSIVQDAIAVYGGKWWTERGEHDPGVTLLQAISFAVSDLAYRHTLPLKDLLTPESRWQAESHVLGDQPITNLNHQGGIFAPEFGPEWALTCGPVTLDDYRRGVLDLRTGYGVFCFRDVQIARLRSKEQYAYTYDEKSYTFQFASKQSDPRDIRHVAGGYQMWVTLNADVDPQDAREVLVSYLKENRNLCEWEITRITFVGRVPLISAKQSFKMVLELEDDTPHAKMAEVIAEVVLAADDWLLPWAVRDTARRRIEQGEQAETIFDGPKLTNGWIVRMPPVLVSEDGQFPRRELWLRDLGLSVMGVPTIKSVQWLGTDDKPLSTASLWVDKNQHGYLWLKCDGTLDQSWDKSLLVRKRGQPIQIKTDDVQDALDRKQAMRGEDKQQHAEPRKIDVGRYRHPGYYQTAGGLLPSVYGLQQEADRLEQSACQLIQFLRPFEQMLADTADQLDQLPKLLAFDGRDPCARVWGAADWPKSTEDPLASGQTSRVFAQQRDKATVLDRLNDHVKSSAKDPEKELEILNYLLGYFGEKRAERTLLAAEEKEFCSVQQGFLRHITRVGYERAAISISKISALQRRISARLGIGSKLFDEQLQHGDVSLPDKIPFFVIENHELLPSPPSLTDVSNEDWPQSQTLVGTPTCSISNNGRDKDKKILSMRLKGAAAQSLKVGQLIEIRQIPVSQVGNRFDSEPILAIVIHGIAKETESVTATIYLDEHARLERSLKSLENVSTTWNWRFSRTWLSPIVYDFKYQTAPTSPKSPTVTLKVGPSFPVTLGKDDQLLCRPKARWHILSTPAELHGSDINGLPDIVMRVEKIDITHGTIDVTWIASGKLPIVAESGKGDKPNLTSEPVEWPTIDAHKYGWAVPYSDDAFAFTVSVVFNRKWLKDRGNSVELNEWIKKIVRDEVPSHLMARICWLDEDAFSTFASEYRAWQDNGRPVGDRSYSLLRFLGIGQRPADARTGIGFVQVAKSSEAQLIKKMTDGYPKPYVDAQVVYVA
ncbi:hypothetical protein [Burkholderia sp. SIMBA_062]|uniref:hypothetical protein n=1 Tax=Burkholderia sp. SIMBA_062 TaxID=3085803 RepID=UPI003979CD9D